MVKHFIWEVKLQQLQYGTSQKKPCSKEENLNQRLKNIASTYVEDSSLDHLKAWGPQITRK